MKKVKALTDLFNMEDHSTIKTGTEFEVADAKAKELKALKLVDIVDKSKNKEEKQGYSTKEEKKSIKSK